MLSKNVYCRECTKHHGESEFILTKEQVLDLELELYSAFNGGIATNFTRFENLLNHDDGRYPHVYEKRYSACPFVQRAFHTFRQFHWQMISIVLAFTNTVINPIIYAVWYPEFRQQVVGLLKFVRRSSA